MENPIQPPIEPPIQPPAQQPLVQQSTPPIQQATQVPPPSPITIPQSTPPSLPKSKKGLFLPVALIILVIILGTFVYIMKKSSPPAVNVPASPSPTQEVTQADETKKDTSLPAGTNDPQLDQDIQRIDSKIGSAESDLGSVDQGLNDQPVNLTE